MKKALIVLVVLLVVVGLAYAVRARGAEQRAEADAEPLFVPVIVTPSVQIASGQVLLYKATNVSEGTAKFRLMLFNDQEAVPGTYKDFPKIPAGHTVSYVHQPATTQLTLGAATVEAPEAVRGVFAPLPGDDPNAVRRIVANVQIMRISGSPEAPTLDPPIVVPLEHCNFEPRGFVPYVGGRWYWNCAPQMYPINERWRPGGQANSGAR